MDAADIIPINEQAARYDAVRTALEVTIASAALADWTDVTIRYASGQIADRYQLPNDRVLQMLQERASCTS